MARPSKAEVIENKPIGDGLNAFRDSLISLCETSGLPCSIESLPKLDPEGRKPLQINWLL